ncbi:homoserine kinase [Oceanospirillum multiglobuliferum]|uniref:Homoserine kinase n=1 Tax=Oceanospirillum multiglobuliferum TaxID=64969 RepID=A0A1T4S0F7_9GAMM|nr:homoserine kinase [Oceanospirillum multiglobuliferum]OPX54528.1 homoserine kinase [Oceanospirillum multiglobuliferum]SKA21723.1 homoserine kinase [Oceanospirillum multiglobuliferum]
MAVYTAVSASELTELCQRYGFAETSQLKGMAGGVENTTYQLISGEQRFILTLFEQGSGEDLDYFVQLLSFLATQGFAVAAPLPDLQGQVLHQIEGKPSLLFPFLQGQHPEQANAIQAKAIGQWLAQLHLAGQQFPIQRPNQRSIEWLQQRMPDVLAFLSEDDQRLMQKEVAQFAELLETYPDLPQGVIHGDLFRDNSFFAGDELTGVIDFYNGCTGHWLYDLAVVINDWSFQAGDEPNTSIGTAVLAGYQKVRPLRPDEQQALPGFLRACALRYWLSRLIAKHLSPPNEDQSSVIKDPEQYRKILVLRKRA